MTDLKTALLFLVFAAIAFGVLYWVSKGDLGLSGIAAVSVFAIGISRVIAARAKKTDVPE